MIWTTKLGRAQHLELDVFRSLKPWLSGSVNEKLHNRSFNSRKRECRSFTRPEEGFQQTWKKGLRTMAEPAGRRLRRRREQLYPWSSFHHQKIPPILWKFKKQFSSSFCKYVNHNAGLLIKVHCSFAHRSVCDAFVVIHSYFKVNCSYTRYLSIAQLFNVFESGHIT